MPIYEFQCDTCGDVRERLFQGTAKDVEAATNVKMVCEKCKFGTCRKKVSRVAPAQFKGTGFYATDYQGK